MSNAPSAEKIISLLVDLLADQYGVKVTYEFKERNEMNENQHSEQQTAATTRLTMCKPDARSIRRVDGAGEQAQHQYA